MTREELLASALKALLRTARATVVAQERYDYWCQFGTHSAPFQRAVARRDRLVENLGNAEAMATAALRGNVTLFQEAESDFKTKRDK